MSFIYVFFAPKCPPSDNTKGAFTPSDREYECKSDALFVTPKCVANPFCTILMWHC